MVPGFDMGLTWPFLRAAWLAEQLDSARKSYHRFMHYVHPVQAESLAATSGTTCAAAIIGMPLQFFNPYVRV
jgi:hypothetical protein